MMKTSSFLSSLKVYSKIIKGISNMVAAAEIAIGSK